jgi:hypothetical protein
MSRKSTILALAAIASLGTFALASTDASARGFGGGGGGGGGGMRMSGGGHVSSFRTPGIRTSGLRGSSFAFRRIVRIHPPHWHPHYRFGWRRPYWIAPVVATGVATYATAPTWNRCTCLTKEYTPEGAVVFKDLCTKEMAMNPPEVSAPAAEYTPAPQPPQTQGYAQPQPYPQYR